VPDLFSIVGPLLRCLDPEAAHNMTVKALELGLAGRAPTRIRPRLAVSVMGMDLPNPLGLAAGFDKDARVPDRMLDLGFGFVEVGTVTPRPQSGNPRPRLFRLSEDQAVINRMGFNNQGMEVAAQRLEGRSPRRGVVGVNIGKNKTSEDAIADYRAAFSRLAPLADYMVVNVSSPNTPGLRDLQAIESLRPLLDALAEERACATGNTGNVPLVLKLAPDLASEDAVAAGRLSVEAGFDGLSISNTTIERPAALKSRHRGETGGLSGRPLMERSTRLVRDVYRELGGTMPIIGVGGIASADDAYRKIRAGASAVQLYSALVYQGPRLVLQILDGLEQRLEADGYSSLSHAVGVDA